MSDALKEWFSQARYGLFLHWGPYSAIGRGEQVLFREALDQRDYEQKACAWNPRAAAPKQWALLARRAGVKYAVFTTRHHDGYCLWDSRLTDYTSVRQAPKRDFVREYVEAFREQGIRIGLYYSLADWRVPAYWKGPKDDPRGWESFREYVHGQVEELLTRYGQIDVVWFDGPWPHSAADWRSAELVRKMRQWQPGVLINNRLDAGEQVGQPEQAGASAALGDFGTPEHQIVGDTHRPWESCQVTTWRLWGYARGERYRGAAQLLDMLVECASKGGNLLLNAGPDGEGAIPVAVSDALLSVGRWLERHGSVIYGSQAGNLAEFVSFGYQIGHGRALDLVIRFWPGESSLRVPGLSARGVKATLLTTGQVLPVVQEERALVIQGLPVISPDPLFPVIRLEAETGFEVMPWAQDRLWQGDARRMASWAETRGNSVWVGK